MASSGTRIHDILEHIQAEYLGLPGLRLSRLQVQRLWHLDRRVCDGLLRALVDAGFLSRTRDGTFVRGQADAAS